MAGIVSWFPGTDVVPEYMHLWPTMNLINVRCQIRFSPLYNDVEEYLPVVLCMCEC